MKKKKMKFNKLRNKFYNCKKIINKNYVIYNTMKKIIWLNKTSSKIYFKITKKNYV